jgi:hypothetical protein
MRLGPGGVALLLVLAGAASQARAGVPLYVRLGAGIAAPALEDWNEDIQDDEDANRANGGNIDVEQIGIGFPVMGEIGIRIADALGLGVMASWQSRSVDTPLNNSFETLVYERDVSALTLAGTIDLAFDAEGEEGWGGAFLVDRFVIGGDAGWAWCDARYAARYRYLAATGYDYDLVGSWEGHAFTASAHVGVDRLLSAGTTVFLRLGYRYQNFGELEGGYTSPQWGAQPGPPRFGHGALITGQPGFPTGEPMGTDLSGVYLLLGLGFGR